MVTKPPVQTASYGPPVSTTTGVGLFLDCNGNMIDDVQDIANGTSLDCNQNGIPDECDVAQRDCNGNGIPDDCDVDPNDPDGNGQVSADCNGNGIPDECELPGNDCNGNGVLDECELGPNDCNGNGVLDSCDIDPSDPDGNGQVSFDVVSPDADGYGMPEPVPDGVPDECQAGVPFFACCLPDESCMNIPANDVQACEAMGGRPNPAGTSCATFDCRACDPDEVGISLLFSNLFRAPVCGTGCPTLIVASFIGLISVRVGGRRRRRRR